MNKKIIITFILFIATLVSCAAYSTASDFSTEMQDSANKSKNSIQNAGDSMMYFANNVGEDVKDMAQDVGNSMNNAMNNMGKSIEDMFDR